MAAAILLAVSGLAQAAAVIGPSLRAKLGQLDRLEPVQVIVSFKGDRVTPAQVAALNGMGLNGLHYRHLPIAGVIATRDQIRTLAAREDVRSVWLNDTVQFELEGGTRISGARRVTTDTAMLNAEGLPYTGKGISVLVNDSGIDATHPDLTFGEKVVQNVLGQTDLTLLLGVGPAMDPVEDVPNTDTLTASSHGTHVAGIVGGTGAASEGRFAGVATGATLVGHAASNGATLINLIGGFEYAIANKERYNIRVVTNSWGTTSDAGTPFDPTDPLNIATKATVDAGMMVVFSAGNSGPSQDIISGNYKKAPWVITVASGTKDGRLSNFSSRGKPGFGTQSIEIDGETFTLTDRPTVIAPGSDIVSTLAKSPDAVSQGLGGGALSVLELEPEHIPFYTIYSGTSMAAPHVAGIIALMLEANPALTWREVKAILEQTATSLPGLADWEGGAGYVNAYAAVSTA
ncbi:MAG TPA: S8 family serine peptidase, partial [Nevskiaceae bacterium]|nr:S8 family serine peptidase [Nevskiaceae bacterium]